jgi:hypothetical protein
MKLYHGNWAKVASKHIGLCLTDNAERAADYGRVISEVEIRLDGLTIEEVDVGYDHDTNVAIGDDQLELADVDVLVYEDESPTNRAHTTYRLVSRKALDAIRSIEEAEEE